MGKFNIWGWVAVGAVASSVVIFFLLYTEIAHFPAGVCIAIVGALATAVTFRTEPSTGEKALWVLSITILVVSEISGLYRADREQKHQYTTITGGLETAISGLQTTIDENRNHFDKTLERVDKAINTETGGDTILYVSTRPWLQDTIELQAVRVGNYPIRGVSALMFDETKSTKLLDAYMKGQSADTAKESLPANARRARDESEYQLQIQPFGSPKIDLSQYPLADGKMNNFFFRFSGFARTWQEYLTLCKVGGQWKTAMMITDGPRNVLMLKSDPEFPKDSEGRPETSWKLAEKTKPQLK